MFQSIPGPTITASYTVPNAQVAPSLRRNLSAGASVVTVQLVGPATLFGDSINQLDLRLAKTFRVGARARIQALVDVYNVLNASTVLAQNNSYGPNWQKPLAIMPGRFLKLGTQINF